MSKKENTQTVYELLMLGLASLSIATIWQQTEYDSYIVWGTWGIFFIDFVIRFIHAEHKWEFVKKHPFLVIAVIPLDAVFQFARFARIFHLLRLKSITKYYTLPFIRFLKKQHLSYVAGLTTIVIFILIIPLKNTEPHLTSYFDALIRSIRALLFFGRSNFEPATSAGHIILVILTLFGVVLHGLVISTAFDYILKSSWVQRMINHLKNHES
ncbi:hypothetical protein [Halobacillus sp. Marseille-P3879]|uniref:hypothetical protein n=1 Tax=Halobacillus sp. Marseille-P3879 TaxID=2045014 RepID=UPI000C7D62BE|nr:hypothetical protein [Halobacillus sp. Marseille-P3879]